MWSAVSLCENGRQGSNTMGEIQRQHRAGQDKKRGSDNGMSAWSSSKRSTIMSSRKQAKRHLDESFPREIESRLNLSNKSHSHQKRA